MNISKKLFLSFVGLTVLVLIATLSLARWGFSQGFSDFVSALEEQRLGIVAVDLANIYARYNEDWERIPAPELINVMQRHEVGNRKPPPHPRRGQGRIDGRPPMPPPKPNENRLLDPNVRAMPSIINTVLLDMQGGPLIDKQLDIETWGKNATVTDVFIEFNSKPIGILRSYHVNPMGSEIAAAFSRQQLSWSTSVGVMCLLLAMLLAYVLSKILLEPIHTVLGSVAKLRSGDYDLRLSHQRHDELGQLMTDIESLSQTLHSTKLAKSKWIADISHELRTPLTILTGEIDLIKAGIRPFDQTNLESLEEEVKRLNRLVEDLYQLSISDTGALRYKMTNVRLLPMLTAVLAKKQHEFASRGIALELQNQLSDADSSKITLYADEQRIEQLLLNLLNNSLQYTDTNGRLLVQISQNAHDLVIIFSDTAPSVNEQDCELLFDPLHRQDAARTRHSSGAGLGLAICRNIVQAHHGNIHATPSKLGGVSITVTLPKTGDKK